ncbi:hypothetical protein [Corynebacterium ulcerans]|uniref:hypothetical protein n=1 Tax=Corynebacterium ulcerans TaxID=65058 RepID=UPI000269D448|nr:hypothetical protein [Corynebacterium ulcerans]AIT89183.1 Hypothetical protein Cul210932_1237 [Corynebacterium ulcerans]ALD94960.1 Hypothetical protein Cul131001_1256 [Corynebacterium ulcerans]ESU58126.1 hypothetical protein D881_07165 [Corynebacterium ulcerans NCTC 12077]SQG58812.1 Uncharacterised protein [Corynebacterium ulcerans]BAM27504.1 hypothetical protein CULC0102_1305 [Corynebacterium ulcerans 0102]
MANPAELLYNLFSQWNNSSSTPYLQREDDASLTNHRLAVKYLGEIDLMLKAMENEGARTRSFRNMYPRWVQTVFVYPNHWRDANYGAISDHSLDVLESLIGYFDSYVTQIDEQKFEDLKKYLDRVEEELLKDDSLDASVKASAQALIQNVRTVMDNYAVRGDFEFEQCLNNLLGNLAIITIRSQRKDTWKKILDDFIFPYTVNNLPGTELVTGGIINAITS